MFSSIIKGGFCSSKNFIFAISSIAICVLIYFSAQLFVPLPADKRGAEIEIPHGTSSGRVFELLNQKGLLRDKNIMLFIVEILGADREFKAGHYSFRDSRTPIGVLLDILRGRVIENRITITEGETIWNVAEKLQKAGIMSEEDFFRLNADPGFRSSLDIDAPSLEGYLFPDTYKFPKDYEPEKVIRVMVDNMRSHFTPDILLEMKKSGMTERDVLTLASIIEKEAVVDFERPIISAVYRNRLKKRMRLDADPTSIYGIKDFKDGITRKDLRRDTPYNTYRRRGLPPGPIAAPGIKSIIAAVYPADVPYLYFVSKNNREHHFSKSSREHFKAVQYYRLKRHGVKKSEKNDRT